MAERTCTTDGCNAPHKARGLCNAHYLTARRRGEIPRVKTVACSIEECEGIAEKRGWCVRHYMLWWRYGDPTLAPRHGYRYPVGPAHPMWRGDDVGWSGVHNRLRSLFGKAAEHRCTDCHGPAAEWSYDNSDPDERPSAHGPYSLDLSRYTPRCVTCHRRFDLGRLAEHTLIESYALEQGDE
jgi:hypothetical protein